MYGTLLRECFGTAAVPEVFCRAFLAMCLTELGIFAEGQTYGEEALRLAETTAHPYRVAMAYVAIGHLCLRQGALSQATLEVARAQKQQGWQAYALQLLGDSTRDEDSPQVALAAPFYRQALTLAESLDMRPLQAHCHLRLGTLYAKTGQQEQASTELSTALAFYRAMDMTFWLPQAAAALAQVEAP